MTGSSSSSAKLKILDWMLSGRLSRLGKLEDFRHSLCARCKRVSGILDRNRWYTYCETGALPA